MHCANGLPNVFAKLQQGQEVRIAYLGGSITQADGWRPQSLGWFQSQFPDAKVSEINAAIGGTGSDLGVYRVQHDVLQYKPDLLFIEFAVNDGGSPVERIHKAIEGIIRQTWRANPNTDICFVYTLTEGMLADLQSGKFPHAASAMEQLADHYAVPSVHMALEIAQLQKSGKLVFTAPLPTTDADKAATAGKIIFSPDGVHPYPQTGHPLYVQALSARCKQIQPAGIPGPHTLIAPMRAGQLGSRPHVPDQFRPTQPRLAEARSCHQSHCQVLPSPCPRTLQDESARPDHHHPLQRHQPADLRPARPRLRPGRHHARRSAHRPHPRFDAWTTSTVSRC